MCSFTLSPSLCVCVSVCMWHTIGRSTEESNLLMAEKLWEARAVDEYFLAKNDEMLGR